ncbi:RNA-binding cell elongation regulator Jag/EloR [Radiobacillus sp. PE A8.2]|uniref:RNA-binding cell elongation regulator Jag/EloR n=1 Tax=Radiobacillus sp. PE A8.2 TaxID=3380349 RepID=UPI00388E8496
MKQVTATGQTVEEAVQSALQKLNTSKDQISIEIIDEGKKGILGIFGSKPAIVKATLKKNYIDLAKKYLKDVIENMDLDVNVDIEMEDRQVYFNLSGSEIALLIGKRGQTLNALQYLLHLVVNRNTDQFYTVVLDAEGYRERRKDTLVNLANRLAEKAISTKREVKLEPMPSFERKIIHAALQNVKMISTLSAGEEPNRHVVIKP